MMTWKDVTVAQFREIDNIINSDLSEEEKNYELVSVVLKIDEMKLDTLSLSDIKTKMSQLDFLNKLPESKLPRFVFHQKRLYKVCLDLSSLSVGRYAELKEYTKVKEEINGKLNWILTTILQPCTWYGAEKKRDVKLISNLAERFDELPMTVAYPIAVFFCQLLLNLNESTEIYLVHEAERETEKLIKTLMKETSLQNSGDGSISLIPSRKKLIRKLMK